MTDSKNDKLLDISNTTPQKSKGSAVGHPAPQTPDVYMRKEINGLGKFLIVGVYSLGIFMVGSHFAKKNVIDTTAYEKQVELLNQKFDQKIAQEANYATVMANSSRSVSHVVSKRVEQILRERQTKEEQIIQDQKDEIASLRYQLKKLVPLQRKPASIAESEQTLPYNSENYNLLRYKQRLEVEKLERRQEQERDAFIQVHNSEIQNNPEILSDFDDKQKLELYSMKNEHKSIRSQFYKDRYVVIK